MSHYLVYVYLVGLAITVVPMAAAHEASKRLKRPFPYHKALFILFAWPVFMTWRACLWASERKV